MNMTVTVSIGGVRGSRKTMQVRGQVSRENGGMTTSVMVSMDPNGAAVQNPSSSSQTHAPEPVKGRIPRVARLMALAIRYQRMLEEEVFQDITQLAAFAQVTQPRMTQIMNLNHLAPDIQERLLLLPPILKGKDTIHEHMLRQVCAVMDWDSQRAIWRKATESRLVD